MLLQALNQYAEERSLRDDLPFQRRKVHLLIPLNADGSVRGAGFVPLSTPDDKGKEQPGRPLLLPRYPGEKNNTKAQYLADPAHVVFGVNKDTLEPHAEDATRVPDAIQQFHMFWKWAEEADTRLRASGQQDPRLQAMLAFRRTHLANARRWLVMWANPKARSPEPKPAALLSGGGPPFPLAKGNTIGFEVGGQILAVNERADPLWVDWSKEFVRVFHQEVGHPHLGVDQPSLCLITGQIGGRVAAMHKPEIKIPDAAAKGAAFFSCGEDAFCSYGFKGGANATVSINAAASYALALEHLLSSDDTCIRVTTGRFCFWAEKGTTRIGNKFSLLRTGGTKAVADFLKTPFSGIDLALARTEQFMSVALKAATPGRVAVRDWFRVPLASAIDNLASWFADMAITPPCLETRGRPYRIHLLAASSLKPPVRKPSSQYKQRFDRFVNELYRCAITGSAPPVHLLEPVLAVFRWALVTHSEKKPKYPLSQSRFALIKLILTRNPTGVFMPKAHLAETNDPAYNLGRLLMVLASLQATSHKSDTGGKDADGLKGPGIVERYYSEASSAPATAFPTLCKLHHHHLRKLEQKGERGRRQAAGFRNKIGDILALLKAGTTRGDGAPEFPRQLSLEEQGRFALGFYQQRTHDRVQALVRNLIRDAKTTLGSNRNAALESFNEAKRVAETYGYAELIDLVARAFPV